VDNETLLRQADEGLYLAKKKGKNRYCTWQEVKQANNME
jgi:PleD family two-component response regulator